MRYQSESGTITLALTGETMLAQALTPHREPEYLALRDLIRSADAGFTNAETLFHSYEDSPAYWAGTFMRTDPALIEDLKWLGVTMMACANNHAYDFGENGVVTNLTYLERANIAHSGTGRHMAEATAATYVDTAAGRVALISATSSDRNAMAVRAGKQRHDFKGRPGANVIDFTSEWCVDEEAFSALKRLSKMIGWEEQVRKTASNGYIKPLTDSDTLIHLLDQVASEASSARYVKSDGFGKRSFINEADMERNLKEISEARRMGDWVIFSMHHHEYGRKFTDIADHIEVLARASIDAGADIFVGHGPHEDRAIELYKGRPIFYSLGDFIMQNDLAVPQPQRSYDLLDMEPDATPADFFDRRTGNGTRGQVTNPANWESFVAIVEFRQGELSGVTLHPVDLGFGRPRWQQGRPVLADGSVAQSVLNRLSTLSEPHGTRISVDGDIGRVVLSKDN